jgi:hypothetical protein
LNTFSGERVTNLVTQNENVTQKQLLEPKLCRLCYMYQYRARLACTLDQSSQGSILLVAEYLNFDTELPITWNGLFQIHNRADPLLKFRWLMVNMTDDKYYFQRD